MSSLADPSVQPHVEELCDRVYADGIAGRPGGLSPQWAAQMNRDFWTVFIRAAAHPEGKGVADRGTNRRFVEAPPELLAGFGEVLTDPTMLGLVRHALGDGAQIVEVAFDCPFPGSRYQPWHRDFPMPQESYAGSPGTTLSRDPVRDMPVLSSLAFNFTTVDVTADMGPFEIAPGTHWDDGRSWAHGMFPSDPGELARYDALGTLKHPKAGDWSVRTGLTVHRGTPNRSSVPRPVLIVGWEAPGVVGPPRGITASRAYVESLPPEQRRLVRFTDVVDGPLPVATVVNDIEGLMMGGEPA